MKQKLWNIDLTESEICIEGCNRVLYLFKIYEGRAFKRAKNNVAFL